MRGWREGREEGTLVMHGSELVCQVADNERVGGRKHLIDSNSNQQTARLHVCHNLKEYK